MLSDLSLTVLQGEYAIMKLSKKYFNMVEIVLALAVVSIAIVSLMGVLPVALKASKNSVADNSVATVAEIMKAYIENRYNAAANLSDLYSGASHPFSDTPVYTAAAAPSVASVLALNNGIFNMTNPPFEVYRNSSNEDGTYRVEFYSGDLSNTSMRVTDFSAVVQIWKENLGGNIFVPQNVVSGTPSSTNIPTIFNNSVINGSNTTDTYVITLVMRISYPADASFDNQEHRYYKFDYFRK